MFTIHFFLDDPLSILNTMKTVTQEHSATKTDKKIKKQMYYDKKKERQKNRQKEKDRYAPEMRSDPHTRREEEESRNHPSCH